VDSWTVVRSGGPIHPSAARQGGAAWWAKASIDLAGQSRSSKFHQAKPGWPVLGLASARQRQGCPSFFSGALWQRPKVDSAKGSLDWISKTTQQAAHVAFGLPRALISTSSTQGIRHLPHFSARIESSVKNRPSALSLRCPERAGDSRNSPSHRRRATRDLAN
jgi:hypothetical protein